MTTDITWPTEAALRSIDIHELLPQQEPFVMVSRLVQLDATRTVSETDITTDNLFAEDGVWREEGLIENIAQTSAARIGYINKYVLKQAVQIGFIGAIRHLEVHALPKVGERIRTIVDIREEVFGMTLATATVMQATNTLLTTEMKIAVRGEQLEF